MLEQSRCKRSRVTAKLAMWGRQCDGRRSPRSAPIHGPRHPLRIRLHTHQMSGTPAHKSQECASMTTWEVARTSLSLSGRPCPKRGEGHARKVLTRSADHQHTFSPGECPMHKNLQGLPRQSCLRLASRLPVINGSSAWRNASRGLQSLSPAAFKQP